MIYTLKEITGVICLRVANAGCLAGTSSVDSTANVLEFSKIKQNAVNLKQLHKLMTNYYFSASFSVLYEFRLHPNVLHGQIHKFKQEKIIITIHLLSATAPRRNLLIMSSLKLNFESSLNRVFKKRFFADSQLRLYSLRKQGCIKF